MADTETRSSKPAGSAPALPEPAATGSRSFEEVLAARRSVRAFAPDGLEIHDVAQLLWSAQGTTDRAGGRTAPSAGGLHPLELYVATRDGLFHYRADHSLTRRSGDDLRTALAAAAHHQECVAEAPAVFILSGVYERTTAEYGRTRGQRYVHMEAGHAVQNLLLQAVARGLAAVPVGAFDDRRVHALLGLGPGEEALYLVPVGRAR